MLFLRYDIPERIDFARYDLFFEITLNQKYSYNKLQIKFNKEIKKWLSTTHRSRKSLYWIPD